MDRKRETDAAADDSNRNLKRQAAAIDMAPFETLPIDVMIKIFLESQFTIKELHVLCNMSRKLRAVCNNRKVWEEIFFRKVMDKEKEMKEAKRNGTLPELLANLRNTEEYVAWNSNKFMISFTRLVALIFYKKYWNEYGSKITMEKDGIREMLQIFETEKINIYNDPLWKSNVQYVLRFVCDGGLWKVLTNKYYTQCTTEFTVKMREFAYKPFTTLVFSTLDCFIDAIELVLEKGWTPSIGKIMDNKLLLCSICSAAPSAFACALCETRSYCSHACAALDPIGSHTHAEHDMDLVLPPHIYIGSLAAAQRLPGHIGAVLSVLSRVDKPKIKDRAHFYVDLDDDPEAPIEEYWDDMADFIYKQADIKGRDILVHCHAGMSRSVSAVIYYMIKYRGYTDADAALEMIQRARPVAGPNEGFMEKLRGAGRRAAAGSKQSQKVKINN